MVSKIKVLAIILGGVVLLTLVYITVFRENDTLVREMDIQPETRDDVTVAQQLEQFEAQRLINASLSEDLSVLVDKATYFSVFVEDKVMIFADELAGGRAEAEMQCDAVAYDVVFASKLVTCVYDGEVMYSDAFVPG